jgi:hypothetical protein
MEFKIGLGSEVRDSVTGFQGIVTARAEFIAGCRQYIVQPPVKKDGSIPENNWLDEERLIVVKSKQVQGKPTGGPQSIPSRKI